MDIVLTVERAQDPDEFDSIKSTLVSIIAQTLAYDVAVIPASALPLVPTLLQHARPASLPALSDPDDFILYSQDEAKHIAYAIEEAFQVQLSSEVVLAAANVRKLASTVKDARDILKPLREKDGKKTD